MKFFITFLFCSMIIFASNDPMGSRINKPEEKRDGITLNTNESVIFEELFNLDNSTTGLTGRGWVWINQDGGGTTATFQGNTAVFSSYEGPAEGYCGQNFNGANGLLIDQWLISPQVTVAAGDTLSFWFRGTGSQWHDSIYVRLAPTGGATIPDFSINLGRFYVPGTWTRWTHVFSISGTIRFTIQYYIADGGTSGSNSDYWGLDLLQVISGAPPAGPGPATNPNPTDGATNVSINLTQATWSNPVGATSNKFYFGTNAGSLPLLQSGTLATSYSFTPGTLQYNTKYYWRVDETDTSGTTPGSIWSFTTMQDPNFTQYCEPFNDLNNWTIVGPLGLTQWNANNSNSAGGTAPELRFNWTPSFTGKSLIRSNPMALMNNRETSFSFRFFFRWYANPSGITTVSITYDDGATESILYQESNPTGNVGPTLVQGLFTTPPSGSNNAQIQIWYDGYTLNFWEIYWDDLCIGQIIPVELTSFVASTNGDNVELNWSTATETNNKGFEVQRKVEGGEFNSVAFIDGKGTTTQAQTYSYSDKGLTPGSYSYRLKQVDFDGTVDYSNIVEVEISAPAKFALDQNYPNPFNPTTTITFGLAVDSRVSLKVFNILGQEVTTLLSQNMNSGNHKIDFNASLLNSGVYFYKLEAQGIDGNNFSSIKKMVLTK